MRGILVAAGVVLSMGVGCQGRPSPEQARAACDHQVELGFWKGFDQSVRKQGLDPSSPEIRKQGEDGLAKERKGKEWLAQVQKCADGYQKLATKKQLDCIQAAKTSDESLACLKEK